MISRIYGSNTLYKQIKRVITFQSRANLFRTKYAQILKQFSSVSKQSQQKIEHQIFTFTSQKKKFQLKFTSFPIMQKWEHQKQQYQAYYWYPKNNLKGVIILHHGLHDYMGSASRLAEVLANQGLLVAGIDYKNFGNSPKTDEKFGCLVNEQFLKTSQQFFKYVTNKYKTNNVYLHGFDIGGLIAFKIALNNPQLIKGVIFLNPLFEKNKFNKVPFQKILSIISLLKPNLKLTKPQENLDSNYNLVKYRKNNLIYYSGAPYVVNNLLISKISLRIINKQIKKFKTPYLFVQGEIDKIANPFTCINFQQKCLSQDKTTVIIENMWHSAYFDDQLNNALQVIKQWIQEKNSKQ